jgi:SSS family transporter
MALLDWIVLVITLLGIIFYGMYRGRDNKNLDSYLLADKQLPWYHVGLSVMATQASAITFLSTPGLAYNKGMGFVQFYFGLPLAMIVLCVTFIPIFQRLNVYTAYEYLEQRFDLKTRTLTASLFLIQRGLSTGISIYAPAIILSTILNLDITLTTVIMGSLVIIYTVYGGTKAVSYTQVLQMGIILMGMVVAGIMVVKRLPQNVGLGSALALAGQMNKTQVLDFKFDPDSQYNVWSGLIGGFFLQLSYFGTDQSQVGRYLTGQNITESRLGLLFNGLLKIPMQFLILLLGVLVFSFYQYNEPPIFFNEVELNSIKKSKYAPQFQIIEAQYQKVFTLKKSLIDTQKKPNPVFKQKLLANQNKLDSLRKEATLLIKKNNPKADDKDYIFLSFVMHYLPSGLVGLLIAIIFLASMGSLAAGLNSLGSSTVIDIYKRILQPQASELVLLAASRWLTIGWGIFCIVVALFASQLGNLIEAVNILGSWFYGTILGVFIVAFYVKSVGAKAVFWAAIVAEICLIAIDYYSNIAYLWFNPIGCGLVVLFGLLFQNFVKPSPSTSSTTL